MYEEWRAIDNALLADASRHSGVTAAALLMSQPDRAFPYSSILITIPGRYLRYLFPNPPIAQVRVN